jgi:hypothetical protein
MAEEAKLEVLHELATNCWNELYKGRCGNTIESKWLSWYNYVPYTPTFVELGVMQEPVMWKKFENELMEGTIVKQHVDKGTWSLLISYVNECSPKSDFAKKNYDRMSTENLSKDKLKERKEYLISLIKNSSPLNFPNSSNILKIINDADLKLINEIILEKDKHGFPSLLTYKKLGNNSSNKYWLVWDDDKRKPTDDCVIL